ncbi:MAG: Holliday junction branch migration protein RuvA [Eggerthellaceae bacterium]|nr:Holliday junction branch migration protein RuvA [Eggerthellaceae bacterium]
MIAFLNGTLVGVSSQAAYLEVGGVGYQVLMSQLALSQLPPAGSALRVLAYLQASESGLCLYGFLKEDEKALFEKLITVSGVGPKAALAALSTFTPSDFVDAVAAQDVSAIQKIPGVGKKTASRIILELKGSLDYAMPLPFEGGEALAVKAVAPQPAGSPTAASSAMMHDIAQALLAMGFSSAEVDLALQDAPTDASESAVLQYALRRLGGR